ncbi:MAG: exodeoxyribonuclease V subunit gamma [Gammaproteobacteria bacterium]|nr:exodeoxyribonuclease V subunit gamma [Gammaproteobacteria bacterium]
MLNVFQSNRLEALVTILAEQVKLPANNNVFSSDTIMVQSPGMSQWLKQQLAEHNGIVANLDFPLPSSFIWRLYQELLEGVPAQSPFNKDRMTWKIYQLLPKRVEQTEFAAIKQYLALEVSTTIEKGLVDDSSSSDADDSYSQLRRYQLSQKIADVFDNYLMYRQHWLDHWQQGFNDLPKDGSEDDIKHQEWQAILWRDVVVATEQQYVGNEQENPLHRAQMHQLLIEKLQQAATNELTNVLPSRLFVFGISTMPQHQLQVLDALSQHIDVQILWLNPCSQYWGDILSDKTLARLNQKQTAIATINVEQKQQYFVVGNPLLASWGRIGRDYLDILTNSDFAIHDVFIDIESNSILSDIQRDIVNLEFRGQQLPLSPEQIRSNLGQKPLKKKDDSLLIHNCHSRFRELEVLKDKLLGWFENDADLLPKDVLVMMPNVDQYAPFIDAVFSRTTGSSTQNSENLTESDTYIPYTIADRGGLLEDPLLNAFTQFLRLPESRFTVSELLDYLELPVLMHKFDISGHELELIKFWLQECHVRWGKSAQHKAKWGLPEINLNTWAYGLQRMVLGFALGKDEVWHDILAYQHIEGFDATILAKLLDYFQFILHCEHQLTDDKELAQWHETIECLLSLWLADTELSLNEQLSVQKIRDANLVMQGYQQDQDFDGKIGFKIVHQFFQEHLNEGGVAQRFLAGSMNFCTLMPMRSVPFKIICVLGLNEGDYPRHVDPISFDLVGLNTPRKGDRSRKFDDRYLFLEALVSAREKLHLSYVGQSSKNNQTLMPSVILSELMDYCQQSHFVKQSTSIRNEFDLGEGQVDQNYQITDQSQQAGDQKLDVLDRLVIKHHLHPYDSHYFSDRSSNNEPTSRYNTYDPLWYQVALSRNESMIKYEAKQDEAIAKTGLKRQDELGKDQATTEVDLQSDHNQQHKIDIGSELDQIDLDDFITFWRHPVRYYYRNILDIKLEVSEDAVDDIEVFEHDGLTQYQMLQKITQAIVATNSDNPQLKFVANELLSGALPSNDWGENLLNKYQKSAEDMLQSVTSVFSDELRHQAIDIDIEDTSIGIKLTGVMPVLTPAVNDTVYHSVTLRFGKVRAEDKLLLWLNHLTKCASGHKSVTALIDKDNKVAWFEALNKQEAQQLLSPWLSQYTENKQRLLTWHISIAIVHAQGVLDGLNPLQIQQNINKEFVPLFSGRNLSNDEYAKQVMLSHADLPEHFSALSEQLCLPLVDALYFETIKKAQPKLHLFNTQMELQ